MAVAAKVAVTAVAAMAVAAKVAVTAVAAMAVAAKVAVTAVVVKVINQLKIDLLELRAGKIAVMEMLLKMQMALTKVVVEEEEVLRLKGETTLLLIMVAQNLKDFADFCYCPASLSCWAIFFKIEMSAF
jgi:hypothetical protein